MDKITQILANVGRCKYFEAGSVHTKNSIKNSYEDGLGRTLDPNINLDHVVVVHILIWDKWKPLINDVNFKPRQYLLVGADRWNTAILSRPAHQRLRPTILGRRNYELAEIIVRRPSCDWSSKSKMHSSIALVWRILASFDRSSPIRWIPFLSFRSLPFRALPSKFNSHRFLMSHRMDSPPATWFSASRLNQMLGGWNRSPTFATSEFCFFASSRWPTALSSSSTLTLLNWVNKCRYTCWLRLKFSPLWKLQSTTPFIVFRVVSNTLFNLRRV